MVTEITQRVSAACRNWTRRISLHGEWECGLTEIHSPHDWYNVRNVRMVVEHEESMHNMYLDDGYYDSPETLVEALNLDNMSRVKNVYDSVTQKVRAHLKGQTKFRLYGDLSDILGFNNSTSDGVFFFGVRIRLGMTFNYLILWVRVNGQG